MTKTTLRVDGVNGKCAVFTGDTLSPFNNPLPNLTDIKFHSDLIYPAVAAEVSGSSSIPSQARNRTFSGAINIYAHGLGSAPVVFGKLNGFEGKTLPLMGDVCVATNGPGPRFATFVHLSADETNVFLAYYGITFWSAVGAQAAIPLDWTIYVLDATVDGPAINGNPDAPLFYADTEKITCGHEKFHTGRRYIRTGTGSESLPMIRGKSIATSGTPTSDILYGLDTSWRWTYEMDGYAKSRYPGAVSGFATDFIRVTL